MPRAAVAMSLNLPIRRAAGAVRLAPSQLFQPMVQRRSFWGSWGSKPDSGTSALEKAISEKQQEAKAMERLRNTQQGTSIFDDETTEVGKKASAPSTAEPEISYAPETSTLKEHTARALDPDPRWRIRYQKRKIMQMHRSGREPTKEELLLSRERKVVSHSPPVPTSVKKLTMLSRQIVGKTVDEAIVQMKFSKKKMAREVRYELEKARDLAIVQRGMGLGKHNGEVFEEPRKIKTKDGRIIEVQDPTRLYVDESWVGAGPWRGMRVQYHARSRMSGMWKPTTRLAIVLKEEKTRIRQHEERIEKQKKAKPWVHLPNRPVTAQRPYYTW